MSALPSARTASEAFALYRETLEKGALIQSMWHGEDEGRQLACALGVLGQEVDGPTKCPTAIMPRWLAQMVIWFFDGQDFADAKKWGLQFYSELNRLSGAVPFSVIHDWRANVVGQLAIEVATKYSRNVAVHRKLAAMHGEALAGNKFTKDEWFLVLNKALQDAYAYHSVNAYPEANFYANANVNAETNFYAYAYANVDTNLHSYAYQQDIKRLANGIVDCLARVYP